MQASTVSARQIDEATWQITEQGLGSLIHLYLLEGSERALLLDTGMSNADLPALLHGLTDKAVFVVNTHGHLDHISANHRFESAWLHPADEELFHAHSQKDLRLAFLVAVAREKGLNPEEMGQEFLDRVCALPARENRSPLDEGQRFDLGGRVLRVIGTPGHTRGSICLLDESRRLLFTGDTVCDRGVLLHLPESAPVADFHHSLERLLALKDDFDAIWPGHHTSPLHADILERYLACARRAMDGEPGKLLAGGAAGTARVLSHEGIALSLPPA